MNLSQIVSKEITSSELISESISTGIANISSVARYIKPNIVRQIGEDVSDAAIVMSIKRLPINRIQLLDKSIKTFMTNLGDITVRSDLSDHTYANSNTLPDAQRSLLSLIKENPGWFYSSCKGVHETTIVCSTALNTQMISLFDNEGLISTRTNLSAVSVKLPPSNLDTHGIYYVILKQLAWQGINLVEILSTSHEITLIVASDDVHEVFATIMSLKNG